MSERLARGFQLFQVRPSTDVTTAFTATVRTEILSLFICNTTGSAVTAQVFHDDDGSTYDQGSALLYDVSIAANTTIVLEAGEDDGGITISPSGTLGVKSGTSQALTFTGYGTKQRKASI